MTLMCSSTVALVQSGPNRFTRMPLNRFGAHRLMPMARRLGVMRIGTIVARGTPRRPVAGRSPSSTPCGRRRPSFGDVLLAQAPVGRGRDVLEVTVAVQQNRIVRDRVPRNQAVEGSGGSHQSVIPQGLLNVECLARRRVERGRKECLHVCAQFAVLGWPTR